MRSIALLVVFAEILISGSSGRAGPRRGVAAQEEGGSDKAAEDLPGSAIVFEEDHDDHHHDSGLLAVHADGGEEGVEEHHANELDGDLSDPTTSAGNIEASELKGDDDHATEEEGHAGEDGHSEDEEGHDDHHSDVDDHAAEEEGHAGEEGYSEDEEGHDHHHSDANDHAAEEEGHSEDTEGHDAHHSDDEDGHSDSNATTTEESAILDLSTSHLHIHDADVYTQSGYDTETGSDAICWVAVNHFKGAVNQLTVASEGIDTHMNHDHRRRRARARVGVKSGATGAKKVQGTKYYVDEKGTVKIASYTTKSLQPTPSLMRNPLPSRRSITDPTRTANRKEDGNAPSRSTKAAVDSPSMLMKNLRHQRRQQQLPSWMTQDFVNEAKQEWQKEAREVGGGGSGESEGLKEHDQSETSVHEGHGLEEDVSYIDVHNDEEGDDGDVHLIEAEAAVLENDLGHSDNSHIDEEEEHLETEDGEHEDSHSHDDGGHSEAPGVADGTIGINGEHSTHNSDEVMHNSDELGAHTGHDDHSSDEIKDQYTGVYSSEDGSFTGRRWETQLVPNFVAGHTSTLPACPHGLTVHVDMPDEMSSENVLRTGQSYKFRVRGEVWLSDLRREYSLDDNSYLYSSDDGKAKIAVQILFCPIGKYCTPFIFDGHGIDEHEEEHDSHDHRYLQDEHLHDEENGAHKEEEDEEEDIHGMHSEDEMDMHSEEGKDEHLHDDHSHEEGVHGESHDLGFGDHGLHLDISHDSHDSHDSTGHAEEHQHITSEMLLLEFTDPDQDIFIFDFEKEVTVDVPGSFVPLGHVQFFMTNGTMGRAATDDDVLFKFDTANTLEQGVVTFQSPPVINRVSRGTEIFSYVVIFLVGTFEAFLLVMALKHRKHSVIKLSQGVFLVTCIFSALMASTATFLFNPKSDLYCRAYGPLIMIPLQIMLAVIIGRLHRIIAIMTPLMEWQDDQYNRRGKKRLRSRKRRVAKMLPSYLKSKDSSSTSSKSLGRGSKESNNSSSNSFSSDSSASDGESGFASKLRKKARGLRSKKIQKTRSLKVQFSERRLWAYVVILSLPQIIIQIIGITVYPLSSVVMFNADESVGRQQCYNEDSPNYEYAEYAVLFATIFYLLIQSQRTKSLPSLFDEAESISSALVSCVVVTAIGIAVIAVSNEPTSSANVSYLMMMAIVMVLTVNLSYRLVMPKLRLIWKGEHVAVDRILASRKDDSPTGSSTQLRPVSSAPKVSSRDFASNVSLPKQRSILKSAESEASMGDEGKAERAVKRGASKVSFCNDEHADTVTELSQLPEQSPSSAGGTNGHRQESGSETYDILDVHGPVPKSLMVTCVEHAEIVDRVKRRLLSGLAVGQEEWEELRNSTEAMSQYFSESCRFAWEGQA